MYIAVIQNNPKVGALRENAQKALESIDILAAGPYPPDIVVFPAFALTGSPVEGLQFYDAFAAETLDVARFFIEHVSLTTLIGTMVPRLLPEEEAFICESEALFCKDGSGRALGFLDIGSAWASETYDASISTRVDGHKISVLLDDYPDIDDDFSDSELVILMLAKEYRGTNTMFTASEQLGYLRTFAQKNQVWVIVANLVGAQDTSVFDGASVVLRPDGAIVAAADPFEEAVLTCNINLSAKEIPAKPTKAPAPQDTCLVKPLLPYEADWKSLQLFIRDYVLKNGFSDVVLGLSGGIDSAVCAVLACDALGAEHVHGILLPGPFSSQGSIDDSLALAANLKMETITLPIDDALAACKAQFLKATGQEASQLAQQNLQPRIRMIQLMQLSNSFNWLLLNTDNKSETAIGYSTLYGDTAGALAVLGNIYKTDVFGLANWRNAQSRVIPEEIITKPPSAELYEGQRDTDTLPPYEVLDHVLRLHIEEGLGADQILAYTSQSPLGEHLSCELIESILKAVRLAEFKRRQEPMSPTLGYQDMTLDRGWPITNGFSDQHHEFLHNASLADYLEMITSWNQPGGWDFLAN